MRIYDKIRKMGSNKIEMLSVMMHTYLDLKGKINVTNDHFSLIQLQLLDYLGNGYDNFDFCSFLKLYLRGNNEFSFG